MVSPFNSEPGGLLSFSSRWPRKAHSAAVRSRASFGRGLISKPPHPGSEPPSGMPAEAWEPKRGGSSGQETCWFSISIRATSSSKPPTPPTCLKGANARLWPSAESNASTSPLVEPTEQGLKKELMHHLLCGELQGGAG